MATVTESELEEILGQPKEGSGSYALDMDGHQLYPIEDREDIQKAASHFVENKGKYPYRWRRQIASNLLKEAETRGFTPDHSQYLKKAAGRGVGRRGDMVTHLNLRTKKLPEMEEDLKKVARSFQGADIGPEEAEKCAEVLAAVDEKTGLYREYDRGLPTPEEVAFSQTEDDMGKQASSMVKLANGSIVTRDQLKELPFGKVASLLGRDFEGEIIDHFGEDDVIVKLAQKLDPEDADTICALLPPAQLDISFE